MLLFFSELQFQKNMCNGIYRNAKIASRETTGDHIICHQESLITFDKWEKKFISNPLT